MKKNKDRNHQTTDSHTPATPRRKRHVLRNLLLSLIVLIVLIVLVVQYGLGFIVRNGAKTAGPALIGTEIVIENAHVRPFFGIVDFSTMRVGPPQNYKADVLKMENFKIILDPKSVLTDTIVIKEITIIGAEVTYELSGIKSNISAIMDRLAKAEKEAEKEVAEKPAKAKAAKKVVIEQFLFSGARIRVASSATGGKGLVIPMPNIQLTDIGKRSGGVTGLQAFSQIVTSVSTGVLGAVRDAGLAVGKAAIDGTKAVAGAAWEGTKAIAGAAEDTAKALRSGATDSVEGVSDAARDGAKAVSGAARDSAKAVSGAARDGAKAIEKSLGGLFSRSGKTNAPPEDTEKE